MILPNNQSSALNRDRYCVVTDVILFWLMMGHNISPVIPFTFDPFFHLIAEDFNRDQVLTLTSYLIVYYLTTSLVPYKETDIVL